MIKQLFSMMLGVFMVIFLAGTLNEAAAADLESGEEDVAAQNRSAVSDLPDQSSGAQPNIQKGSSRILVAYFSRTDENYGVGYISRGNTAIVAEMIAGELGADLFRIERVAPYPENYNDCTDEAKKEQLANARPPLRRMLNNLNDYDVIYLGMPVWWGDMPMPVYTFVEGLDWNGKVVYPFTTHAGSRLGNIPASFQRECAGATVKDGLAISGYDAQNNQKEVRNIVQSYLGK